MALAAALSPGVLTPSSADEPPRFPPRLEEYLSSHVTLSGHERASLHGGQPVTRLLDSDASKEIALFGAIWIAAPPERYVQALSDIEHFEKGGGFRITRKVSSPPRLEDFAGLTLPEDDVRDLEQ